MDGMKDVRLPQYRPRRTRVPQDRARQQRHRPRDPDYPRKSSLPGMPGIAWPALDPPPQPSASSDAPANQIARIAHRGVFTQPGSTARITAVHHWRPLCPQSTDITSASINRVSALLHRGLAMTHASKCRGARSSRMRRAKVLLCLRPDADTDASRSNEVTGSADVAANGLPRGV